ncbi:hypothetical protein TUM4438_05700 [Shewanella sairae]|uniref:Uncharacterized protein n=1 Tax=Shewanella sairae TaxID=190310 RepID=A0ABQ4P1R8_9GAMM|nr:hypothetical protein [Shewanella sairae]MCL1129674.1 hypothetical protein [Shewanella sairae]GIU41431.1 hypothetical protein TUM4438_05700 [Shewanella sairae]
MNYLHLKKTNYLLFAGLISLVAVSVKVLLILFFPAQLFIVGVSLPTDYSSNHFLQDQNQRFCIFLIITYAIFTTYCAIASTKDKQLPFMISVLTLFALSSLFSTVLTLCNPLIESIESSYRYWPIWVINSLTELIIATLAFVGLKHSWKNLTAKINYQQNIVMLSAMVIAFSITQFYVPDSYMDWSLTLMKQYKELLTQLPYELDVLISMFWFSLPKYVILFTISIALLAKLGHGRHFVYALLLSFILLQFVLKQLPIISTLVIGSTTKVSQIILLSNSFAIGLLVVMVGCLSNTQSKNLGTGKV